eukprot:234864-Hanusia_phi.AAC.4
MNFICQIGTLVTTVVIQFLLQAIQFVSNGVIKFNEFKNCDPSFNQTVMNPWACRIERRTKVVVEQVDYDSPAYGYMAFNTYIPTPVYQNDVVILHFSNFYMIYHTGVVAVILFSMLNQKISIWTYFISVHLEYMYMMNFLVDIIYMYNTQKIVVIIWVILFDVIRSFIITVVYFLAKCNDRVSFHDISDSEEMRRRFMHTFYCKKITNPLVWIISTAVSLYVIYMKKDANFHVYRLLCVTIIYMSMAQLRYSVLIYLFNGKRTQFVKAIIEYNHVFSKAVKKTSNFYLNYTGEVDDDVINFKLSDLFSILFPFFEFPSFYIMKCLDHNLISEKLSCWMFVYWKTPSLRKKLPVSKFYKNLRICVGHSHVESASVPAVAGARGSARARARAPGNNSLGIGLVRASADEIAAAVAVVDPSENASLETRTIRTRTEMRRQIIANNARIRNEEARRRAQLSNGGDNVGWIFAPFTIQELNDYTRDQSCVYVYPPEGEGSYMRYWVLFSTPPEGGLPRTFIEFLSMLMNQGFKKNILCLMFAYTAPVHNELEKTLDGSFHVTKSRTF